MWKRHTHPYLLLVLIKFIKLEPGVKTCINCSGMNSSIIWWYPLLYRTTPIFSKNGDWKLSICAIGVAVPYDIGYGWIFSFNCTHFKFLHPCKVLQETLTPFVYLPKFWFTYIHLMQWHRPLIKNCTNLWLCYVTGPYYRIWVLPICVRFSYNICNGYGMPTDDAYSSRHLVLSKYWTCMCSYVQTYLS